MNTFLPCNDFARIAKILDPQRLSRQITEVCVVAKTLWAYKQLMHLCDRQLPWGVSFPSVIQLWISPGGEIFLPELWHYQRHMNYEWAKLHNGKSHDSFERFNWNRILDVTRGLRKLQWPEDVYLSHRGSLIAKDRGYYSRALERNGLKVPDRITGYVWEGPQVA